ncbi:peptide-methionine (R)-S-oxide reductase MsrB [soil metagenome]
MVPMRRRTDPPELDKSDEEWRSALTPEQYHVLRRKGTEHAFAGEHIHPGEDGTYRCVGCGAALFDASSQFDSGTGWPSFTEPAVSEAVSLRRDFRLLLPRTEVTCRRCGGHLGHVFRDGPGPGGRRFCINSCALDLEPR